LTTKFLRRAACALAVEKCQRKPERSLRLRLGEDAWWETDNNKLHDGDPFDKSTRDEPRVHHDALEFPDGTIVLPDGTA